MPTIVRVYTSDEGQSHMEENPLVAAALCGHRRCVWGRYSSPASDGDYLSGRPSRLHPTVALRPTTTVYDHALGGGRNRGRRWDGQESWPGDVLLAEDLTGQGHIARRGEPATVLCGAPLRTNFFGVLRPWRA